MQILLVSALIIISLTGCKAEKKQNVQIIDSNAVKQIVKENPFINTKEKAYQWANNMSLDLDYIAKKKLGDKKHLAELLGIYWKLYKTTDNIAFKKEIQEKVKPYFEYTKSPKYHNMLRVDNKLFKKNSMSYLRVMWLYKELDFDISNYKKEVSKIRKRMNAHLLTRGDWQKEVFKAYYNEFNYKMPEILKKTKLNNGLIDLKLPFNEYDKNKAYNFTHFVFAAYNYGNNTTQSRFDEVNKKYINEILPKLTKHYRETKPNIDLLGEFFTCMVYMGGHNDTEEFTKTYRYLVENQNNNGSWGKYERHRKKIGDDVDFRIYIHTTLVVFEGILEYNEGEFSGSKNVVK